jgi:hypothetical protein
LGRYWSTIPMIVDTAIDFRFKSLDRRLDERTQRLFAAAEVTCKECHGLPALRAAR